MQRRKSYYAPSDEDELEPLKRYKGIYEGTALVASGGLNYSIDGIGAGINLRYPTDIECADGTYEFWVQPGQC